MQITLKGSAQYKHLHYKSDYDVLLSVKKDAPPTKVFNDLETVLQNIEKDPDNLLHRVETTIKEQREGEVLSRGCLFIL